MGFLCLFKSRTVPSSFLFLKWHWMSHIFYLTDSFLAVSLSIIFFLFPTLPVNWGLKVWFKFDIFGKSASQVMLHTSYGITSGGHQIDQCRSRSFSLQNRVKRRLASVLALSHGGWPIRDLNGIMPFARVRPQRKLVSSITGKNDKQDHVSLCLAAWRVEGFSFLCSNTRKCPCVYMWIMKESIEKSTSSPPLET